MTGKKLRSILNEIVCHNSDCDDCILKDDGFGFFNHSVSCSNEMYSATPEDIVVVQKYIVENKMENACLFAEEYGVSLCDILPFGQEVE